MPTDQEIRELVDLKEQDRLIVAPVQIGIGVIIQKSDGGTVKCRVTSLLVEQDNVPRCKAVSIDGSESFEFTHDDWLHSVFPVGMKPLKVNKPPEAVTLSDLLHSAGLSQRKLAECLGTSQAMISYWCTGKFVPDAFQALELAFHLKCRVETVIRALKNTRDQSSKYENW